MLLVVKVGGRILNQNLDNIVESIARLVRKDYKVILVHGGGDLVTEYSKRLGIEPKIYVSASGVRFRYTDEEELKVYMMVIAGLINKTIVSRLLKLGVKAIGLSGVDAAIMLAERKKRVIIVDPETGRKRLLPGGYTGKVKSVNKDVILKLVNEGYTLVIAPLAVGEDGTPLNIDGDQAAFEIAKAVSANKLIFLTDVEGVLLDGKLVERLTVDEAKSIALKLGPGMNRKVLAAAQTVEAGVDEVIIGYGGGANPVEELLEGSRRATRITKTG